jgi:hypothetical protein
MTRTARPVVGSIIAALTLAIVIVACGSSATPAPAGATPTPATSSGAGSSVNDPLGGLFGSLGLGSFGLGNLLHGAPDLEAILPAQLCGAPSLKFSFGGASFGAMAGQIPAFADDFIGLTGKSFADVSFASASSMGSGDCPDITAFKVNGLNEDSLRGFYTQMETSDGNNPTQASIGGKNVVKSDGSYAYFKNDTVFVIDTSSDDTAAATLQLLP